MALHCVSLPLSSMTKRGVNQGVEQGRYRLASSMSTDICHNLGKPRANSAVEIWRGKEPRYLRGKLYTHNTLLYFFLPSFCVWLLSVSLLLPADQWYKSKMNTYLNRMTGAQDWCCQRDKPGMEESHLATSLEISISFILIQSFFISITFI